MGREVTSKSRLGEVQPYVTKDGSEIRELLHPSQHAVSNQSLAEARIPAGCKTILHVHQRTEEIYHVTHGTGVMTLGDEQFPIAPGDSVLISPGMPHRVENTGKSVLIILCCCAPAYSHEDTTLLAEPA